MEANALRTEGYSSQGAGSPLEALELEIARLERVADRSSPVLVVDDMQTMRLLLAQVMKAAGFSRVHRASDGESALRVMTEVNCDLCLVDWNMPRMDGLELLIRVRRHELLQDVVFIMITAETLDRKVMQAAEQRQDAYLTKPVSAEKLTRRLDLILERRLTTARALRLEAMDNPEGAVEEFMAAAHNRPRARWPLFGLGGLFTRQGNLDEAERCYRRILQLDPSADAALVDIGRIKELRGDVAGARILYQRAKSNNPKFFRAYDALVNSMLEQGEDEQALDVLQEAMAEQGTENAARQHMLGRLSYRLGNYAQAEEALARAMELEPTRDKVADNLRLAHARLGRGRLREAIELLDQVAAEAIDRPDPSERVEALMLKGGAQINLQDLPGARKTFADLKDPLFWPTGEVPFVLNHYHREVGGIYLRSGLHEEALEHFTTSILLNRNDKDNLDKLAALCEEAGAPQLVDAAQEQAARNLEQEVEQCSRRGLKLVAQSQFQAAMAEYRRGLALDPSSGRLYFNVGKLWHRLGQSEEAVRSMVYAAKLGVIRRDWELVVETARFFSVQGRVQQAKGLLAEALNREPGLESAKRLLAQLAEPNGPSVA